MKFLISIENPYQGINIFKNDISYIMKIIIEILKVLMLLLDFTVVHLKVMIEVFKNTGD